MAVATLEWVPGGGPYSVSQGVYYSEMGDSGWILDSTVGVSVDTASIGGLLENVIYHFQITNNCGLGNSSASSFSEGIFFACPEVDLDVGTDEVTFTFTHLGGDVDSYVVELWDEDDVVVDSISVSSPGSTVSDTFTGLSEETDYQVVVIPHATGDLDEYTMECAAVPFTTDALGTTWSVVDVWYDCPDEVCDGEALYCDWFEVRRVSDNLLIYRYDHDNSAPTKNGSLPSLVNGTSYELEAEWIANTAKTNFSASFLTGNSTSDSWPEPNVGSVTESITFTGVSGTNNVSVGISSEGPLCDCTPENPVNVILSNSLGGHCGGFGAIVYLTGGSTFVSTGLFAYTDPDLTSPQVGYSYISDSGGTIYNLDSLTGEVLGDTGNSC